MNPDLDKYWQRIADNDEKALEELYKAVFPVLVHYANSITGAESIAEEVVQDVMLKLWQERYCIVIQGSFASYLFRMVHNHALNARRLQKTQRQSVNQPRPDELWAFIASAYELSDPVIDQLFAHETEALIEKTVDELPDQCRKVFRLSRYDSIDNKEIAKQLGLSENTIKTHIYKALHKISGVLKKNR